jgi:SAM-dependent MidA family methyltransferase
MTIPGDAPLADRLRRRIEAEGPMTFADFMDAALYDPEGGFYSRLPVGERGDFVTSPHVSPVFGELVARQVHDFWELLDGPDPFDVVEVGAGDGTLARQVLASIVDPVRPAVCYTGVDRSPAARRALGEAGIRPAAALDEVTPGLVGCVLANELLDDLPFHRVRGVAGGVAELFVGLDEDRLTLIEGTPSSEEVVRLAAAVDDGKEGIVRPLAAAFIDQAVEVLARGYVWMVDYGFRAGEEPGTVHGYRRQRLEEDVLSEPGSLDITAGVDFAALVRHARDRGLAVWGPVTQRDALLSLGFRQVDDRAQERQRRAVAARRGVEALRIYSNRTRANLLLSPTGLGAFYVLCLGVGTDRPPRFAQG